MSENVPILELKGIKKSYPGVHALKSIHLKISRGEIHGLVGENGAGKSTLIKILAGVTEADEGVILFNGRTVEIRTGREAHRLGLSFIHQELNLIPYFNCMENIFLGHSYPKKFLGMISWKKLRSKTLSILERLEVKTSLGIPVSRLSLGIQAMIAIARAFATSAAIYFMDEPTASLTDNEKEKLFSVIKSLKKEGATIVYVSHQLEEIVRLTDRVTVMRDGEIVGSWGTKTVTEEKIIQKMIGRDLVSAYRKVKGKTGEVVLSVSGLNGGGLNKISFKLHRGEIFGIAGLVGSGRTELLRMLYGVEPIDGGKIVVNGNPFKPRSPKDSIRRDIVYVPEERRTQGLILDRSVSENITLVYLKRLSSGFFLNRKLEKEEAERAGISVKLKAASLKQPVKTLSGGNQQKVVFAKCLLCKPLVLMLDEPTRGVDIGARFEIYSIIREMASQGTAVLVVSSDFHEFLNIVDRFLILREGYQKGIMSSSEMDEETLLTLCYGRGNIDEKGA